MTDSYSLKFYELKLSCISYNSRNFRFLNYDDLIVVNHTRAFILYRIRNYFFCVLQKQFYYKIDYLTNKLAFSYNINNKKKEKHKKK